MIISVIQDEEKMLAIGTPVRLAKLMMPDVPWKETYVRIYDSNVRDPNGGTTKNIVISSIKFSKRFIKSSVVFREDVSVGREQAMSKMFSMLRGQSPDDEEGEEESK